jgi:hypothetical protein
MDATDLADAVHSINHCSYDVLHSNINLARRIAHHSLPTAEARRASRSARRTLHNAPIAKMCIINDLPCLT